MHGWSFIATYLLSFQNESIYPTFSESCSQKQPFVKGNPRASETVCTCCMHDDLFLRTEADERITNITMLMMFKRLWLLMVQCEILTCALISFHNFHPSLFTGTVHETSSEGHFSTPAVIWSSGSVAQNDRRRDADRAGYVDYLALRHDPYALMIITVNLLLNERKASFGRHFILTQTLDRCRLLQPVPSAWAIEGYRSLLRFLRTSIWLAKSKQVKPTFSGSCPREH